MTWQLTVRAGQRKGVAYLCCLLVFLLQGVRSRVRILKILLQYGNTKNRVVEPDPHGTALIWLSWSRIRRYWKCGSGGPGSRSKEINETLLINLIFSLSKRFCAFVLKVCFITSYLHMYIFHVNFIILTAKSDQDPDPHPHWLGFLDPDPHWGKTLDPDPHWSHGSGHSKNIQYSNLLWWNVFPPLFSSGGMYRTSFPVHRGSNITTKGWTHKQGCGIGCIFWRKAASGSVPTGSGHDWSIYIYKDAVWAMISPKEDRAS